MFVSWFAEKAPQSNEAEQLYRRAWELRRQFRHREAREAFYAAMQAGSAAATYEFAISEYAEEPDGDDRLRVPTWNERIDLLKSIPSYMPARAWLLDCEYVSDREQDICAIRASDDSFAKAMLLDYEYSDATDDIIALYETSISRDGNPRALERLARAYRWRGKFEMEETCIREAANYGISTAMMHFGMMLKGTDNKQALKWLYRAIAAGNGIAVTQAAYILFDDRNCTVVDQRRAATLLVRSPGWPFGLAAILYETRVHRVRCCQLDTTIRLRELYVYGENIGKSTDAFHARCKRIYTQSHQAARAHVIAFLGAARKRRAKLHRDVAVMMAKWIWACRADPDRWGVLLFSDDDKDKLL